ncbi:DUF2470 domain-containing protein [Streptomyces sp. TR06-5]|uniref:DUF2470 domain-containing protein n=1 Tax=Streptomyces sp. TR06-5 TaxID=3385976 RepID=UPI0039A29B60
MFRPGSPHHESGDGANEVEQPRPVEGARQPSAAQRLRTLVESSVSAVLSIPGAGGPAPALPGHDAVPVRAVDDGGSVILLLRSTHPAAAAPLGPGEECVAVMELTDVAPVAVPHRVRARASVAGWLSAVAEPGREDCLRLLDERGSGTGPPPGAAGTLLRLEVGEAQLDDLRGRAEIEPDEFATAPADPLAGVETELLQHLASAHAGQVRRLCGLLPSDPRSSGPCRAAPADRVVPLSLDRFGLRLRLCGEGGCRDAHFPFDEPVSGIAGLRRALRRLFEAAER